MSYQEHAPAPGLAPFVECYWTTASPVARSVKRVMPDGCADIIVRIDEAHGAGPMGAEAVGTMRQASVVSSEPGVEFVAVRFNPGAAGLFLATPLGALTDQTVPLEDLWHGDAAMLAERLAACPDTAARIEMLNATLAERFADHHWYRMVAAAARRITCSRAPRQVSSLAAEIGTTTRTLERAFGAMVGMPPRMFVRVARLRRAVNLLHRQATASPAGMDWPDIVHTAGYYDQAHLAHEFAELAGVTPTQYLHEIVATVQSPHTPGM